MDAPTERICATPTLHAANALKTQPMLTKYNIYPHVWRIEIGGLKFDARRTITTA
jgi:hypothetical protein